MKVEGSALGTTALYGRRSRGWDRWSGTTIRIRLLPRIGRSCCAVPEHLSQEGLVSLQIHYKCLGPLSLVVLEMAGFLGYGGKLAVKVPTSYVRFRTKASRGWFTRC
jgi:hypothetical protein